MNLYEDDLGRHHSPSSDDQEFANEELFFNLFREIFCVRSTLTIVVRETGRESISSTRDTTNHGTCLLIQAS